MAGGILGKLRKHFEAEPPVELGCLEAVGVEHELPAAAAQGFRFRFSDQPATEATTASGRCHPYLTQLARTAPSVSRRGSDDVPGLIAHEDAERSTIADTGRADVALVEPVFEEL